MLLGVIAEKKEEEENQCDTVAGETRLGGGSPDSGPYKAWEGERTVDSEIDQVQRQESHY